MGKIEKIAAKIVDKWLRKGNMARCMRDILPRSGLSLKEREDVARLVHRVVRYKRYYDAILDALQLDKRGVNYIKAAAGKLRAEVPDMLEIRESMSPALAKILQERMEFLSIINREPETMLCANLIKASRKRVMEMLEEEGYPAEEYFPESAIKTTSAARYSKVVKEGFAHVQDASSQMIAKIAVSLGERILDFCAGSGGKTLAMASLSRNTADIHAYDINRRKLKALEDRARRHGVRVKVEYEPPDEKYDVVLVDAPCSGIGAASRNPEAKYVEDFSGFVQLQLSILQEAKKNVRDGGRLIYVVCSFSPQETVELVDTFLQSNNNFTEERIKIDGDCFKREKRGWFVTLGDILYFAVLRKEAP